MERCSPPGSSVLSTFRQEYWSGLSFPPPGDLPDTGIETESPESLESAGRFFTIELPGNCFTWLKKAFLLFLSLCLSFFPSFLPFFSLSPSLSPTLFFFLPPKGGLDLLGRGSPSHFPVHIKPPLALSTLHGSMWKACCYLWPQYMLGASPSQAVGDWGLQVVLGWFLHPRIVCLALTLRERKDCPRL